MKDIVETIIADGSFKTLAEALKDADLVKQETPRLCRGTSKV